MAGEEEEAAPPSKKQKAAPAIVSHDEWVKARKDLLVKEKELTKAKAVLAKQRQDLPWEETKDYEFSTSAGKAKLSDLFGDKEALIVWHFMFSGGENGCHMCSFFLDGINGIYEHLKPRASFCAVALGPADELEKVKENKGWIFPVASCRDSSFAQDFGTAFAEEAVKDGTAMYNYGTPWKYHFTAPGLSVFQKKEAESGPPKIYHTYSSYAAGLADFNSTFDLLDAIPEGRDESGRMNMWWVKHKEKYGDKSDS